MVVLCRNKLWNLDMPWLLYDSLKKHNPNEYVIIEELTQSSYKEQIEVPIKEVEDYSEARNKMALGFR